MKRLLVLTSTMLCWVLFAATAWAQQTVSGKVTNQSDGTSIPGVSVIVVRREQTHTIRIGRGLPPLTRRSLRPLVFVR